MIKRISFLLYGVVSYAIFLVTFSYAAGFVGNILVPKSIDSGPQGPLGMALLVNAGLLLVFALQHSIMARQGFKRLWTKIVPQPIERSTYTLFSSLALILLFTQWQPMGGVIWEVQNQVGQLVLHSVFALGILIVLLATFLINHFDLFGLRQVWLYLRGRAYTKLEFETPFLYKYVRHPLYVGFILFMWATPTMTVAHLVFAFATTAYILIAIQFEEKDLVDIHGSDYTNYREQVPMIVPGRPKVRTAEQAQEFAVTE